MGVRMGKYDAEPNSVTAYCPVEQKLVLVTANLGSVRLIKYDLSQFRSLQGSVKVRWWSTDIDIAAVTCSKATQKPTAYVERPAFEMTDLELHDWTIWFDANFIQTFEITGLV